MLTTALQITTSMEAAAREVMELQGASNVVAMAADVVSTLKGVMHKVTTNHYRCVKPDHEATQCLMKRFHCYNCSKVGHVKKVCMQTA